MSKHLTFAEISGLWRDPEHLHLTEYDMQKMVIARMDPEYLVDRGAKTVIRQLRVKYRREVKKPGEDSGQYETRIFSQAESRRTEELKSFAGFAKNMSNILETFKEKIVQETWAEMDKWLIKGKPLRTVTYEELIDERSKDASSAEGALRNVEFYDGLLKHMKPGQQVFEAVTEGQALSLRDSVFSMC